MQFFHISRPDGIGSHKLQAEFFAKACEAEGIEYIRVTEETFDALDIVNTTLSDTDIVYRSARGAWGETVEREWINDRCKHAYTNYKTAITGKGSSYYHLENAGLPVVPSIPFLPRKKNEATAFVERLDGFPLIVKVIGGTEGVGIIRVDGLEALNSLSDFLRKDEQAKVRVMKYIPHPSYVRLVVVDGKVVAAATDTAPSGDFRTNARGPRAQKGAVYEPTPEMEEIAIRGVEELGVRVGGVDILCADDGAIYVTEVNMPFNFAETQQVTGIDIAHAMVTAFIR